MPTVKVGDINMYYEVHGNGEPLVFIGGGGASVESSYRLIPTYSREYQLVLFDNRGSGRTDRPDIPYTTEMMADDLAGLLDIIGIQSAHISGVSFGGMIAQQFALRYPERVKSLILVSTYCGGHHSIPIPAELTRLGNMEYRQELTPQERAMEVLRFYVTPEFMANNPGIIQQRLASISQSLIMHHGVWRQYEAEIKHDTYERLPEIKAPTLVFAGEADRVIPVENSRILASRIPNAELVILKNAGHFLLEAGDEPTRLRLDFLKRHRTTS